MPLITAGEDPIASPVEADNLFFRQTLLDNFNPFFEQLHTSIYMLPH